MTGSEFTLQKLEKAIANLKAIVETIPEIEDQIPGCWFETDGKKAKIILASPSLQVTRKISFWELVDDIGSDNGKWYHPLSMEFWIKAFRKAADKLERDLKDCRSKPDEWEPLDDYN